MKDLYHGELVRLSSKSPEEMAKAFTHWNQDTECYRLADSDPAHLWSEKKTKEWIEKEFDGNSTEVFMFSVHTLDEEKLIGYVTLEPQWSDSDAWVGIVIGDREFWDRGYGTDAMHLLVQYGFMELGLQRVSLALHSYNTRALKSYQKAGFDMEGIVREGIMREGRRTDTYVMGILRNDWLVQQGEKV